jgi:hypothetical protein
LPTSTTGEDLTSYAAQRAKLLLGCYRTGDANDPQTYVAAITAVLARFPREVITAITHPVTGLPSKKDWLPTVKEVFSACHEAYAPILENEARLKRIKEQVEMREREERGERPTMAQLKAKYGNDWGISQDDKPPQPKAQAPNLGQLRHHYAHYDLAFKPKEYPQKSEEDPPSGLPD